jgi:hypothetical protein
MKTVVRFGILVVAVVSQGCYTYVPLEAAIPPVGETVSLQISDRGRVELSERFGPGLERIEGLVTSVDSENVVMNVYRVAHIGGLRNRWSGETVRVRMGLVDRLEERRLSRARTYTLAAVATGAVAALVASQGLFGWYTGDNSSDPGDGPAESLAWPARLWGNR